VTTLRSGSATDVGKVRTSNQDVALEDPDLFAVADGMGGHVGGEVAARVAVDSLRAAFQRQPTVEGLRQAVAEANRAVWRQGQTESELRGMGTTLTATALVAEDGRQVVALANVGDSRAYVYSEHFEGQLIQVTADHSLAEEKVRQGQLTEAEAAVHPHRHILTRALGVSSDVDVDLWELHLHDGDRILLCSDGLTNEIGDERIGQVLGAVKDPTEAATALVRAALDHGGSDNVTCVVIDVVGTATPADPLHPDAVAGGVAAGAALRPSAAVRGPRPDEPGPGAPGEGGPPAVNGRDDSQNGARDDETRTLRAVSGGGPRARSGTTTAAANGTRTHAAVGSTARVTAAGAQPAGAPPASATEDGGADGAGRTQGAALSSARLQAAELRRLRPTREDRRYRRRSAGVPRLVTVRVVLFVLLLLAVVAAAYAAVRWYAMDDWYVGIDHGHLAVYQGRPGGFLWFKPQLVDDTPVTTGEVPSYSVPHDRQEPSLAAAKRYVTNLHDEYLSTKNPSSGGTTSGTSGTSGGSTSATTGAFAPPVGAWQ
jgi:PPM family protein phosphatase